MFLLAPDRPGCLRALTKLHSALGEVVCGPIAMIPVGDAWLGWFRARPSDNLHLFSDALILGKLFPGEAASEVPMTHVCGAPASVHSLVTATRVEPIGSGVRILPFNTTNVFYDRDSASDMQLLIANAKGYRPAAEGVAILGTVGYFPGDLTLFSEISRIALFHALDLGSGRQERIGRFESLPADDSAMMDRLVSVVPAGPPALLGISGGCDSRFVLGILLRAGVRPNLVRLSDDEDSIACKLAAQLGLPLTLITEPAPDPEPEQYTVMTDAQIYFRGGHYGRLRRAIPKGAVYFSGLFADSLIKNAFRAAWKVPRRGRDMTERLIEHALLSRMRSKEPGLIAAGEKGPLLRFLRERIAVRPPDGPFERSKELAAWFYFTHRGARWTPAHLADLSFFAELVEPLSDLRALALGIRSSAWENFGNDRVRLLNERLLPETAVGYSSGQTRTVNGWPRRGLDKLFYEYGTRAVAYLRGRSPQRAGPSASRSPLPTSAGREESLGFRAYFDRSFAETLGGDQCSRSVKRAAITVNSALLYLERKSEVAASGGVECAP